jgi:hypothetical protein
MRVKWSLWLVAASFGALLGLAGPAAAQTVVSCGGAVAAGGAELLCSHVNPRAPAQLCTYSWALSTPANQIQIVDGDFLLPPGSSNVQVYQGAGFARATSEPIVICQGKRGAP